MISDLDLINIAKEVGLGILFVLAVMRLTSAGMQFMDRRAAADERRSNADDALMTRLLQSTEQQIKINDKHADFQAGLLRSITELSAQIVAATATITSFSTAVSKTVSGLLEAVTDGNTALGGKFESALDQKTDLALRTIERVQATADAISTGQSAMQDQIRELAQTIVNVADGMRALQTIEEAREGNDEQFRAYMKSQLQNLTQTLSSAEQSLVALSQSTIRESANYAENHASSDGVGAVVLVPIDGAE